MLNLSHNVLIQDPKSFKLKQTEEAKAIKKDRLAKFTSQIKADKMQNKIINDTARPTQSRNSSYSQ